MKKFAILFSLLFAAQLLFAQGLENIITEIYYVSDANDATDTDGGELVEGSVTYRIFVDMQEGYELQAVYGNSNHEMRIATTTVFFNNEDRGEKYGQDIGANRLDENTVALDSWLTMGGASDEHLGVPKEDDSDGSIVGGQNNDGGSEGIAGGLLVNDDAQAGIPLTTADGLVEGTPPDVTALGIDDFIFDNENDGTVFSTESGSWASLEGVQGPTTNNIVLIAQITTDGNLSYELNIQLGTPDGGTEQYVARDAQGEEIHYPLLIFPAVFGCTDPDAINYNEEATIDDGSCEYLTEIVAQTKTIAGFELFPNPVSDQWVQLAVNDQTLNNSVYAVYDVTGTAVLNGRLTARNENTPVQINVGGLSKGMYFVELISATGASATQRLIVQ